MSVHGAFTTHTTLCCVCLIEHSRSWPVESFVLKSFLSSCPAALPTVNINHRGHCHRILWKKLITRTKHTTSLHWSTVLDRMSTTYLIKVSPVPHSISLSVPAHDQRFLITRVDWQTGACSSVGGWVNYNVIVTHILIMFLRQLTICVISCVVGVTHDNWICLILSATPETAPHNIIWN